MERALKLRHRALMVALRLRELVRRGGLSARGRRRDVRQGFGDSEQLRLHVELEAHQLAARLPLTLSAPQRLNLSLGLESLAACQSELRVRLLALIQHQLEGRFLGHKRCLEVSDLGQQLGLGLGR